MQLLIMRHATAEEDGPDGSDASRRLTARGREEAAAVGRLMRLCELRPDSILSSSRVRAFDTALLVAKELRPPADVAVWEPLTSGCDLEDLRRLCVDLAGSEMILLTGHEPDTSRLIRQMTGAAIQMKKGMLASVDLPAAGCGWLRWVWPASHARKIIASRDR